MGLLIFLRGPKVSREEGQFTNYQGSNPEIFDIPRNLKIS